MSDFDHKKPHGTIYGAENGARYEQGGKFYTAAYKPLNQPEPVAKKVKATAEATDPNDPLRDSKTFLMNVLRENPLSKSVVYRETESNNQSWPKVREASLALGIVVYKQGSTEMWRLPDTDLQVKV